MNNISSFLVYGNFVWILFKLGWIAMNYFSLFSFQLHIQHSKDVGELSYQSSKYGYLFPSCQFPMAILKVNTENIYYTLIFYLHYIFP